MMQIGVIITLIVSAVIILIGSIIAVVYNLKKRRTNKQDIELYRQQFGDPIPDEKIEYALQTQEPTPEPEPEPPEPTPEPIREPTPEPERPKTNLASKFKNVFKSQPEYDEYGLIYDPEPETIPDTDPMAALQEFADSYKQDQSTPLHQPTVNLAKDPARHYDPVDYTRQQMRYEKHMRQIPKIDETEPKIRKKPRSKLLLEMSPEEIKEYYASKNVKQPRESFYEFEHGYKPPS